MSTVPDHRDSLEPQHAFVAFFDVLGFEFRLQQNPLQEIVNSYRELAAKKMQSGTMPILSRNGVVYHQVGSTIFSDTILFWCNDDWKGVQGLLSSSAYLIAAAIDIGWPLRGGLAYGQCVLDRDTRTFIGQPIVNAYHLEESQEWIGAGLHASVIEHPLLGTSITRHEDVIAYAVPTKRSSLPISYAIHWCPYSARARVAIREMKSRVTNRKARRYYKQTLKYVLAACHEYHAAER